VSAEPVRAPGPLRAAVAGAALAVSFLTVLPVRFGAQATGLGPAAGWFPAVGALVGAIAGGVRVGADPLVGPGAAAVLSAAALVVVTGALHQDGLADCADGLGVRGDRDGRLAAMRDSSIGVFGALALLVWMLLLVTALARLDPRDALLALVAAGAAGRWAALLHAVVAPPARRDGLGAGLVVGRLALTAATATAAVTALLAAGPGHGLAALLAAASVALLVTGWARTTIGGRTGDTLGATVALAEVAVCLTLLGFASG
jgi:adenosylcobinamide-GDP ribazoletransferase